MKLGVLSAALSNMKLKEMLAYLKKSGVQAVEIGSGGYPGKAHCDPEKLLADGKALDEFKSTIAESGIEIGALSCHGNPVHPDKNKAQGYIKDFKNTIILAEKLGVDCVVTFSGCPGGAPQDTMPNWVTCPWPPHFLDILKYQWEDVLIPYWKEEAKFCMDHGIQKVALEMHPGFCVYGPESLLKLRDAAGPVIGANFDPSHLFWQGIDPVSAIRYLGEAIYYFHAKDTKIDDINTARTGVLDIKHYGDEINRSWVFRTVGYGHPFQVWKDIFSNLRMVGYDGVISIEHEDSLMSPDEGLQKAIAFLKQAMMFENVGEMFWA